MLTKILEVRDRATFIPTIAISMIPSNEAQRYLLRRAGYSCEHNDPIVLFGRLEGGEMTYDPYNWGDGSRTMKTAHVYVAQNFAELKDGDVIDVEFILGETTEKKISEKIY